MDKTLRVYVGVIVLLLISIIIIASIPVPELTSTTPATPVREKTPQEVRAVHLRPGAAVSVTVLTNGAPVSVNVI